MNFIRSLGFFFLFLVASFSLSLAYEDSVEKRVNLWPLGVYSKNKIYHSKRLELLGPFIYKYQLEKEEGVSLRPLFSSVKTFSSEKEPLEKRIYFLAPLGLYFSDNETTTFKLIPLINQKIEKTPIKEEKEGTKWEYFPIFIGKTAEGDTYGGIFPIYGKLKDRFGKEEITFFLWPLYSKVTYEKFRVTNILWPFIRTVKAKTEGDPSYRGFKVWPFYGEFKEGEEERKFVLWPFYIKSHYKDEYGNFEEKVYYFPFYGREKTDTYEKTLYLWPFFQKIYRSDPYYKQIDAPWPFYRNIEGKEIEGKRIWPFYGYVKKTDSLDLFILWPFYFYQETSLSKGNTTHLEKEHRFLLLSKQREVLENSSSSLREFRFWPFYYGYEDSQKEIKLQSFPALFPFYDEGVERNYGALFKILENFEKGNYQLIKFLWGLYRYEKFDLREIHELAFLLRVVQDKTQGTNYFEFLEGLLGFGKIEKKPVFKLFFINLLKDKEGEKNESKDCCLSGNF